MITRTILLLLCLAPNCLGQHTNVIKFYLHPNLVTNLSFVRTNLAKYVSDMNYILAKNTGRVLSYNTNTGLILTNQQPHDQQEVLGGNPNTGYEIWVHAIQTTQSVSHGGYMSVDSTTGAGVLAGFNWTKVYNPDTITNGSSAFIDYRTQISSMLHEFGHVFGGGTATGVGEYYNQVVVDDTTGVPPLVNIRAVTDPFSGEFNYQDIFWGLHAEYAMDPLLRPAPATNRAHLLSLTYRVYVGKFDESKRICHRCDTPACCNPKHLFQGTDSDNMNDCSAKGRLKIPRLLGEQHPKSVINDETARAIIFLKRYGFTELAIANKLGITKRIVNCVASGKTWKQITESISI